MKEGNGVERIQRSPEDIKRAVRATSRVQAAIRESQLRKRRHSNIFGRAGLVLLSLIHGGLNISPPNPSNSEPAKAEQATGIEFQEAKLYKQLFLGLFKELINISNNKEIWKLMNNTPLLKTSTYVKDHEGHNGSPVFLSSIPFSYGTEDYKTESTAIGIISTPNPVLSIHFAIYVPKNNKPSIRAEDDEEELYATIELDRANGSIKRFTLLTKIDSSGQIQINPPVPNLPGPNPQLAKSSIESLLNYTPSWGTRFTGDVFGELDIGSLKGSVETRNGWYTQILLEGK